MNSTFIGTSGFVWFHGIVEDVNDPEMLGRLRVRIFGVHSREKVPDDITGQGIPTEMIPWASVSSDMSSANVSGIGDSTLGVVNGAMVWGFSRDGADFMDLVICGTFAGIPREMSNQKGFQDPDGKYPLYIGESDLPKLSREITKGTWVEKSWDNLSENSLFKEPKSPFAAKYPFNRVNHTRSGHTIEIDDTPKAERLSWVHKTGTFEEWRPDGSIITKVTKDKYNIVAGDDYIEVSGNVKVFIKGNVQQVVEGNVEQHIKQNVKQTVDGNVVEKIGGNRDSDTTGTHTMKASKVVIDAPIETTSTIKSSGDQVAGGISTMKHIHDVIAHSKTSKPK